MLRINAQMGRTQLVRLDTVFVNVAQTGRSTVITDDTKPLAGALPLSTLLS